MPENQNDPKRPQQPQKQPGQNQGQQGGNQPQKQPGQQQEREEQKKPMRNPSVGDQGQEKGGLDKDEDDERIDLDDEGDRQTGRQPKVDDKA